MSDESSRGRPPRVLVIVQNLSVPLDRRVWLECQELHTAGYDVEVICPRAPGEAAEELLEGVRIHRYPPAPRADGFAGYVREFAQSWASTARTSVRIWRRERFDVIQACNPPDTYWALARLFRPWGVKFVYDQHDLCPELFESRFGGVSGAAARVQHAGLRWLERMTYRTADHVISTNGSYRTVALQRGGKTADEVTVVRSGPDTARMRPVVVGDDVARGAEHLLVYLGVMGPQDGVNLLVDAVDRLVNVRGRRDIHVALLGFGDCVNSLKEQVREHGLDDHVTFTGRADARMVARYLSAAHIGLCPDPKSPLNDVSTMNKTMEYMAYALPVVAFDLKETRVSAGDAAVYAPSGDVEAFADEIEKLLDDEGRRAELATAARERVAGQLDWKVQAQRYVGVFNRLTGQNGRCLAGEEPGWPEVDRRRSRGEELIDQWGHQLVDLRDRDVVRHFVQTRRLPIATPAARGDRPR